jgi:ankyrin repeat protein
VPVHSAMASPATTDRRLGGTQTNSQSHNHPRQAHAHPGGQYQRVCVRSLSAAEQVFKLSCSQDDKSMELKALLETYPRVTANLYHDEHRYRSLHAAAYFGNAASTRLLVDVNADLEARAMNGQTPLNKASHKGNLDCVQVLIESKADVQTADDRGSTPAHGTAQFGHSECLRLLIDANADLDARDKFGYTPLFLASRKGTLDCVQVLIESKAGVRTASYEGRTPAHSTADNGHSECLKLLINANADVNARHIDGVTPAMHACQRDRLVCLQLLVNNKADLSATCNDGKDSVYFAIGPPTNKHNPRVPGMPFAVLSCDTDSKNVLIDERVTQAMVTAHVDEFKQIHAFIDDYHTVIKHALSEDVAVDKRVRRRGNGLYHEPLVQVLLYLGLSMDKDQTVNTSIDGETVKRALIPGQPLNANLWFELYQRIQLVQI